MTKGVKKFASVLILACMLVGVAAPQTTLAAGAEDSQATEEEEQGSEEPVSEDEAAKEKQNAEEPEDEESATEISVKDVTEPEEVELEDTAQEKSSNEAEDGIIEKNSHEVNFILIMSPYLETPGTQQIVVSYGDGTEQVEEMTLDLQDPNGNLEALKLSKNVGTIFAFEKSFSSNSESGTYVITQVHVTDDSGSHTIMLSDLGMDARFGVNEEYDGIEELEPLDEETAEEESEGAVTATIASIDDDSEEAVDEVVNALQNAENDVDLASVPQTLASTSSDVVVALDPGHDTTHAGATGNGLKEENLTLKIANYCKEELETYNGVSVYMTRTSSSCPYPSTSSSGADIKKRVEASVAKGAKYYVSIHINDANKSSAKGAEVIIPNSNWKPSIATQGKELAQAILDELEKAGMTMRSTPIYSKDSQDGTKYSDGSTADYYSVQHNCKLNGIPGIIVEHGFISNTSDVNNFLGSNSGLKKLGVADATGIANYLGLSKASASPKLKSATAAASGTTIEWSSFSGAKGYAVYRKKSGGSWSMIDTTTSTSYTDKASLTSGTTYYYTVRAYLSSESDAMSHKYNSDYWSGYDSSGLKSVYLSSPKLTSASTGASSTTVKWNKVSGAKGYAIYRKKSGGSWSMITTTTSTSYEDSSSLSGGATYYYTVRAYVDSASKAKSNKYNAAYWGGYDSTGIKAVYLSKPSLSSAKAVAAGTQVSWKSVSGAKGYAVYRKKSGGSWSMIDTTTSTSYTDNSSLSAGKTYYYTVRAYTGDVTTAKNNRYNAAYWSGYNTTGLKSVYLATPKLSSAKTPSKGTTVKWGKVSGASGYAVYRKKSGGDWSMITTTTSTSYTDTASLSGGKTYYYTVRAYTGNVKTAKNNRYNAVYWSGYNSTGLKSVYMSTPSLSSAKAVASGTQVNWKSVSGAKGYAVYRKKSGGGWSMIDTTTSTSYTDKASLSAGKTYYYTVRAYTGDVKTAKNNKYNAAYWSGYNTTGLKSVYLAIPKLSSVKTGSSGRTVSWGKVSSASGYAVYRKTSGGDWSMLGATTSTSYTDKASLTAGKTYYYTVRAYTGAASTAKSHKYNAVYWSGYDSTGLSVTIPKLTTPVLKGTTVVNDGIKVSWNSVSGASGYAVFRKTSSSSWSRIGTTTGTSYTDTNGGSSGTTYYYTVRAYSGSKDTALKNTYSSTYWSSYNSTGVSGSAYEISGTSTVSVDQMVKYYNNNSPISYPSSDLSSGGASTIKEFAQIFYEEAEAEGIKVEVAWCQTMLETGWLKYGGQVSIGQFNFAGIGATDGGAAGAKFTTVREGVRAQIQHLKAYATTSSLKQTCVDPRFNFVTRGSAKYVEILGAKENPLSTDDNPIGWATGAGYGSDIVKMIMNLKNTK